MNLAKSLIQKHEGLRFKPYRCPAGRLTIGFGRNLEGKGISKAEAHLLLFNDLVECEADLQKIFTDFDNWNENRKAAILNMRFQLGPNRFRGFKKMIAAIQANDWELAAVEAKASKWYKQVTRRAEEVINLFND